MENYLIHLRAQGTSENTISTRRYHLRRIAAHISKPLKDASTKDLEQYLAKAGESREYKRSLLTSMRSYYRFLQDSGVRADNPALHLARIKPVEPSARPASDIAYYRALKNADERERLMLKLAGVLGLRRGEVAQVHVNDLIEDIFGYSLLVHGKGGKTRILPLNDDLTRELRKAFKHSASGFAFEGDFDGHLSPAYIGKLVSRLLPSEYSMHSLRHRAATTIHAKSHDMLLTQKFLGHASPETTQRYVHQDMEDLRRLLA